MRLFRPVSQYWCTPASSVSTGTAPPGPSERNTTYPERPDRGSPPASVRGALQRTSTSPALASADAETDSGAPGARSSARAVAPTKPDSSLRRPLVSTAATR